MQMGSNMLTSLMWFLLQLFFLAKLYHDWSLLHILFSRSLSLAQAKKGVVVAKMDATDNWRMNGIYVKFQGSGI